MDQDIHLTTYSPIDNSLYVERPFAEPRQITAIVDRLHNAQQGWRSLALPEKIQLCIAALTRLQSQQHEIAEEICWQIGRPITHAGEEIRTFTERCSYLLQIAEESLAPLPISGDTTLIRYIKRVPLGTVLIISGCHYPYLNLANTLIPALLAGNTVLLCHSHQAPLCAERLIAAFKEEGIPDGVLEYLHITTDQTCELIASNQIDYVCYTDQYDANPAIRQQLAASAKPCYLELSGKDPAYIRHDADLNYTVPQVMDGAFYNAGQSNCAVERIYVHHTLYKAVQEKVSRWVKQLVLDRPDLPETTLGPLVNQTAANHVRNQLKLALKQGATPLIDPNHFQNAAPHSPYVAPQVITNVRQSMAIMQQPTQGPLVTITPVNYDAEAIALMNDCQFGCSAGIFTEDIESVELIGERLNTGTIYMNRCDLVDPALSWRGCKQSGIGSSLSRTGFDQLTRPKSFYLQAASGSKTSGHWMLKVAN